MSNYSNKSNYSNNIYYINNSNISNNNNSNTFRKKVNRNRAIITQNTQCKMTGL